MGYVLILKENGKWCVFGSSSDCRILDDATDEQIIEFFMEREKERLEQRMMLIKEGKTPVRFTYQEALEREEDIHGKEYLEQGWDKE
jgi:hypothetical protein